MVFVSTLKCLTITHLLVSKRRRINTHFMVKLDDEELYKKTRQRIIQEYAYELCYKAMHPEMNECCGKPHRHVAFLCPYKIKCPNCEKYVPAKRFTDHLGRCVKKYEK